MLIAIGLATRLAALRMSGFVIVQSLTDLRPRPLVLAEAVGVWFHRLPDSAIMDQRALLVSVLPVMVINGADQLDRLAAQRLA
ncbi:hypothetical protein ACEWPL_000925 [Roseovarius sp. S1116L3]|uniref:hypothetical protein n=1 Tax=Roseovarius roseus TaxID=3342636 RepID=UPI003728FA5D